MSDLTVITHPDCAKYHPAEGHPERPERLAAAMRGIEQLDSVNMIEARPVESIDLARVHTPDYLQMIETIARKVVDTGQIQILDRDTHAAPGTLPAANLAAGAACQAVDHATGKQPNTAFAVVRPPGHHAESNKAMGFCYFNNIGVAAAYAKTKPSIQRVVICDFDVHHGNGSEEMFSDHPDVLFISSHQHPLYPGTGHGELPGADNIVNFSLPPGSGSNQFRDAWQHHLLPTIDQFKPDLILVSAGFDAHWRDPLAQLDLKDEDYYWIGHQLKKLSRTHCKGELVAALEGGYDLKALTDCTLAFAEGISSS